MTSSTSKSIQKEVNLLVESFEKWSTIARYIILQETCTILQSYLLGKRRMTASSRSNGRFVAPRMRIFWLSFDLNPSHADMNSFLILLVASCSKAPPRAPSKLSTYIIWSPKFITGRLKRKLKGNNLLIKESVLGHCGHNLPTQKIKKKTNILE